MKVVRVKIKKMIKINQKIEVAMFSNISKQLKIQ